MSRLQDRYEKIRCIQTSTNTVKWIPRHVTEDAIFMKRNFLIIQDLEVKKELEKKIEVVEETTEIENTDVEETSNDSPLFESEKKRRRRK